MRRLTFHYLNPAAAYQPREDRLATLFQSVAIIVKIITQTEHPQMPTIHFPLSHIPPDRRDTTQTKEKSSQEWGVAILSSARARKRGQGHSPWRLWTGKQKSTLANAVSVDT